MTENGTSGPSESLGTKKKKVASSNLLNLKFMQRGRDAEVAEKLEQQVKEVSDQQWHLSVIQHIDSVHGKAIVSYEPSYNHFESKEHHAHGPANMGRKIFGAYVPDIDDLIKGAKDDDQDNETNGELSEPNPADDIESSKKDTKRLSKRVRGEDAANGAIRKHKKAKKKEARRYLISDVWSAFGLGMMIPLGH